MIQPSPSKRPAPIHGVLVFDKPVGPTSHDIVAHVRRTLHQRDIGHAGTLDPMATGVLVIAVGEATKLAPYLTSHAKTYEAEVRLGSATDSYDATGTVTGELPLSAQLLEMLRDVEAGRASATLDGALHVERTRRAQVPPLVSAIHVDGERAYEIARRGETRELPPRDVSVNELTVLSADAEKGTLRVRLDVSKGYFVRSFARDLATTLGTYGHLTALRRVRSGPFDVAGAVSRESDEAALRQALLPLAEAASRALPCATLAADGVVDARAGRRVAPSKIVWPALAAKDEVHAWLAPEGGLIAIGTRDEEGNGKVVRGFNDGVLPIG